MEENVFNLWEHILTDDPKMVILTAVNTDGTWFKTSAGSYITKKHLVKSLNNKLITADKSGTKLKLGPNVRHFVKSTGTLLFTDSPVPVQDEETRDPF